LFSGKLGSVFGGLFSFRKAFAYAQIGVAVYKVKPVTYIAAARAIKAGQYRRPIEDLNWEANIKELPQAELNKARPMIQGRIDSAIKRALQKANLTP
jgi:hypothetical protein